MPAKTPLNAVIHGKVERDDFTVERVFFESMPGFYVTGSLFRPKAPGKYPAVLCPHGHWANGRFYTSREGQRRDCRGGDVKCDSYKVGDRNHRSPNLIPRCSFSAFSLR